jgi:hypothetical protein
VEQLLGPNEVLVAEEIVTEAEQATIMDWLTDQHTQGKLLQNPQDSGAYSTPFRACDGSLTSLTRNWDTTIEDEQKLVWLPRVEAEPDQLPEEFWNVRTRVQELLGLIELDEDPYKGSFMSLIEPGTGVHQHRDDRLVVKGETNLILRCNVLLQKPDAGGLPVFDGRIQVNISDRGMWAFFPTELVHASTTVIGARNRGLLSFGFLVPECLLWKRWFRATQAFVQEYAFDTENEGWRNLIAMVGASARATGIAEEKVEVLEFVMSKMQGFSLAEISVALGRPPADIFQILWDLQRSGVVESESSLEKTCGRVLIIG